MADLPNDHNIEQDDDRFLVPRMPLSPLGFEDPPFSPSTPAHDLSPTSYEAEVQNWSDMESISDEDFDFGEDDTSGQDNEMLFEDELQDSQVQSPQSPNSPRNPEANDEVQVMSDTSMRSASSTGSRKSAKGKPKDRIWAFFKEVKATQSDGTTLTHQKCNRCGEMISSRAPRLRNHYNKCIIKATPTVFKESQDSVTSDEGPSGSKRRSVQPKISSNTVVTTKAKKAELDKLVAKFWYSANIAFNNSKLRTWKSLCSSLRPGYIPPSEYELRGSLLDETYDELHQTMKEDLKGKSGVLIQDGWSDVHNSPSITHTVVCNKTAYLLNLVESKASSKTAEYCAEQFEEAMTLLQDLDFQVIGGSTDNCNVMVKMRRILGERHKNLLFYGCSPHMLNLLAQDITPKTLVAKINEVSKYFRDHHEPAALLKEKNGLKPQLPGSTRWISHLECIRVFLANRTKYIEVAQQVACTNSVTETVNSLSIFRNSQDLLKQMEEISAQILSLQSDDANIADALHAWLTLYNSQALWSHKDKTKKRMDIAIEDFFFVAYLLHPKYKGELLSESEKDLAFEQLLEISAECVSAAHAFLAADTTVFPKSSMNEEVMNISIPANWWISLRNRASIPKELVDYIVPMYRCQSSTASVERIFSTYGYVQNDKRNRLSQDKVMKLSFCFKALRAGDENHSYQSRIRTILSQKV